MLGALCLRYPFLMLTWGLGPRVNESRLMMSIVTGHIHHHLIVPAFQIQLSTMEHPGAAEYFMEVQGEDLNFVQVRIVMRDLSVACDPHAVAFACALDLHVSCGSKTFRLSMFCILSLSILVHVFLSPAVQAR